MIGTEELADDWEDENFIVPSLIKNEMVSKSNNTVVNLLAQDESFLAEIVSMIESKQNVFASNFEKIKFCKLSILKPAFKEFCNGTLPVVDTLFPYLFKGHTFGDYVNLQRQWTVDHFKTLCSHILNLITKQSTFSKILFSELEELNRKFDLHFNNLQNNVDTGGAHLNYYTASLFCLGGIQNHVDCLDCLFQEMYNHFLSYPIESKEFWKFMLQRFIIANEAIGYVERLFMKKVIPQGNSYPLMNSATKNYEIPFEIVQYSELTNEIDILCPMEVLQEFNHSSDFQNGFIGLLLFWVNDYLQGKFVKTEKYNKETAELSDNLTEFITNLFKNMEKGTEYQTESSYYRVISSDLKQFPTFQVNSLFYEIVSAPPNPILFHHFHRKLKLYPKGFLYLMNEGILLNRFSGYAYTYSAKVLQLEIKLSLLTGCVPGKDEFQRPSLPLKGKSGSNKKDVEYHHKLRRFRELRVSLHRQQMILQNAFGVLLNYLSFQWYHVEENGVIIDSSKKSEQQSREHFHLFEVLDILFTFFYIYFKQQWVLSVKNLENSSPQFHSMMEILSRTNQIINVFTLLFTHPENLISLRPSVAAYREFEVPTKANLNNPVAQQICDLFLKERNSYSLVNFFQVLQITVSKNLLKMYRPLSTASSSFSFTRELKIVPFFELLSEFAAFCEILEFSLFTLVSRSISRSEFITFKDSYLKNMKKYLDPLFTNFPSLSLELKRIPIAFNHVYQFFLPRKLFIPLKAKNESNPSILKALKQESKEKFIQKKQKREERKQKLASLLKVEAEAESRFGGALQKCDDENLLDEDEDEDDRY